MEPTKAGSRDRLPLPGDNDGFRRLALATVQQAVTDTKKRDPDALAWLVTTAPAWLEACGMEIPQGYYREVVTLWGNK